MARAAAETEASEKSTSREVRTRPDLLFIPEDVVSPFDIARHERPSFAPVRRSSVLDRVAAFLPELKRANEALSRADGVGSAEGISLAPLSSSHEDEESGDEANKLSSSHEDEESGDEAHKETEHEGEGREEALATTISASASAVVMTVELFKIASRKRKHDALVAPGEDGSQSDGSDDDDGPHNPDEPSDEAQGHERHEASAERRGAELLPRGFSARRSQAASSSKRARIVEDRK